jgi:hypothetical protein
MTTTSQENMARVVDLLAQHWPRPGEGRHDAYLALIGGLFHAGVDTDTIEEVVRRLVRATDDEDGEDVRLANIETTRKKKTDGKKFTGWPSLARKIGDEAVLQVRLALDLAVTVEALAEEKKLPQDFLEEVLGLWDTQNGVVAIPYRDAGGRIVAQRQRVSLHREPRLRWEKGSMVIAYGEDHLDQAVKLGRLTLVEGESDCWTLWYHGEPALGIPGNNMVAKALCEGHVRFADVIYAVQEPGEPGETFVENIRRRLAALGWRGKLYVIHLGEAKDPSGLHCRDPQAFNREWQDAFKSASPVELLPANVVSPSTVETPWPDAPGAEAFHGLAGDIVRLLEPASEADPAALLVQVLVGYGNLIGRSGHQYVEADQHYGNEFVAIVGRTAKARKGTSWGRIRQLLAAADEAWMNERVLAGVSSGEGVIWAVRDPVNRQERIKEDGHVRYEQVEADPGVTDKRLLIMEPELANVLKQTERQGNTLSAVLRQGWDGTTLGILNKNTPARATDAHISLISHITVEELRRYLSATEQANGFGNRFLWFCARRSKELPEGGRLDDETFVALQHRLGLAVEHGRSVSLLRRDEEARELWRTVYSPLSADRPGLAGAMLGRAEAHVLRLSMLYALLDQADAIRAEHLLAALALWDYAERSVVYLFGDSTGDPVADDLLRLLRAAPDGMSRRDISNALGRNVPSNRITQALTVLAKAFLAHGRRPEPQGPGRPEERWYAGAAR